MYMDTNSKIYNVQRVKKIKTFGYTDDNLNQMSQVYNTVLTVFNYLSVDQSKNFLWKKMVQSDWLWKARWIGRQPQ